VQLPGGRRLVQATRGLGGVKVASYYGCLLVRPNDVTGFDDPENPVYLDRIIDALGGESVDWPHKVECCGASLTLTRPDMVVSLSGGIIDMAAESGAECIAVACPMCQMNLDMRQDEIGRAAGKKYKLPVMYITQLMGIGLGLPERDLSLNRLVQSPKEILAMVTNHE